MNPAGCTRLTTLVLLLILTLSVGQAGSSVLHGPQCTSGEAWSFQTETPQESSDTTEEEEDPEC